MTKIKHKKRHWDYKETQRDDFGPNEGPTRNQRIIDSLPDKQKAKLGNTQKKGKKGRKARALRRFLHDKNL
jgi:hypothetical protein